MKRILFVCHGNICRSPMAEFIFRQMAETAGCADAFLVASAATSNEEIGNPVYPPARAVLNRLGIDCRGKTARRITARDYSEYDLIIGMDQANYRNLKRFFAPDDDEKNPSASRLCRTPRRRGRRSVVFRRLRTRPHRHYGRMRRVVEIASARLNFRLPSKIKRHPFRGPDVEVPPPFF